MIAATHSLVFLVLATGLAGCGSTEAGGSTTAPATLKQADSAMTEKPNPVPDDVMDRLLEQISRESGVERNALVVERAEQVTWSDGALGCPQPNVSYLQALVTGFWVVVLAGEEEFDYRIDDQSRFVRCTGATRQAPIVYPPQS